MRNAQYTAHRDLEFGAAIRDPVRDPHPALQQLRHLFCLI